MTSPRHDIKLTGGGKFQKDKYSPRLIRQSFALAAPFGMVGLIKDRIRHGFSPAEALASLDIVLFSADGRITPASAECYRIVTGLSVEEIINKVLI